MGVITVFLILGAALQLSSATPGVCSRTAGYVVTYPVYTMSSTSYRCGSWLSWRRCNRYYERAVYQSRFVYRNEVECCSGYEGDGSQCSPICSGCNEPHVCKAPNTCLCHTGWTGQQCSEDIDECQTPGICEHHCINTAGSYLCSCPNGSVLADDQSSCIESPWNVTLSATSPNSVRLTWKYHQSDDMDRYLTHFSVSCPPDAVRNVSSSQFFWTTGSLSPYSVYNCCVTANTMIGISSPVCDTETTLEDVPLKAPVIASADRTEANRVLVKWEHLNLEDLRGSLVSYEIVYYDLSEEQCPAKTYRSAGNETISVTGGDTYVAIANLDPRLEYCVGVAAKTGAGVGEFNYTTMPLYTNTVFTVAFEKCTQWILEIPLEKTADMVQEIMKGINQFCHCQFTSDNIRDEGLLCDQEACYRVVLQGRIISTNNRNSTELLEDLEKWVSSKPAVVVQGEELQVVSNETRSSLNCHKQEKSNELSATLGSVVAVILVLLCFITATVFGVVYCKWRLTKRCSGVETEVTSHAVAAVTPTSSVDDDAVLKDLLNPLYDQHSATTSTPAEHEVPHQQVEQHRALANPTYGMAEPGEPNEDPVSIPMYGLTSPQQSTVNASNDCVYSEVAVEKEGHIYDIPARD